MEIRDEDLLRYDADVLDEVDRIEIEGRLRHSPELRARLERLQAELEDDPSEPARPVPLSWWRTGTGRRLLMAAGAATLAAASATLVVGPGSAWLPGASHPNGSTFRGGEITVCAPGPYCPPPASGGPWIARLADVDGRTVVGAKVSLLGPGGELELDVSAVERADGLLRVEGARLPALPGPQQLPS